MKKIYLFLLPLFLVACDPADLQRAMDTLNSVTNTDIANGLKQALNFGVDDSVKFLSRENGYYASAYKILLPEEARKVTDKLKFIPGFQNVEEELIKRLNKGAEDAASKAGPIFFSAIKSMSFDDAMNILMGPKDAATTYLNNKTYTGLYSEFSPIIDQSLEKFNVQDYWAQAVNQYNKIPFITKVNPDLKDYVATEALKGLFSLVAKKELGIREDVSQRTTDLLKKVFAKQDS
ncbi:MAG: hypothetical protein ACI9P5_002671 [Saprospiraceae bacterium]|jgi:hypothetical protein|tara:strand:+ start:591 stop:1292 length:702 start_codon:yes stop_codon:yes gene_type:complete